MAQQSVSRDIFNVGVFMIIPNVEGNHVLFVRDPAQKGFSLPGGAPREDIHPATENILLTGVRETKEEACVIVVPRRIIGMFSLQHKLGFLHIVEGVLIEELPFEPEFETVERRWVSVTDIMVEHPDSTPILPAQRAVTQQYIVHRDVEDFPLLGSYRDPTSIAKFVRLMKPR
jgi:hypothetical protein